MKLQELLNQQSTKLIGILNVTPDSFSGDGIYQNEKQLVMQAEQMLAEGIDILDIGGESSRPGAEQISVSEEIDRIIPAITILRKKLGDDFPISIDTYKAEVAISALESGATIINSLGGFLLDPKLAAIIAKYHCPIIPYHLQGNFSTMHEKIITTDIIEAVKQFFKEQIVFGEKHGITRDQFLLDPGIGFSKTLEQTVELLKRLGELQSFHLPIVIGVSRKSHIGLLLQDKLNLPEMPNPHERLEGALAETAIAVMKGAAFIRTHDVKQTKRFLSILDILNHS